jgi:hypothetical protein
MVKQSLKSTFSIALLLSLVLFAAGAGPAHALSLFGGNLGGKIRYIIPCTCNIPPSLLINVGFPNSGTFIYTPGISTLYKNFLLLPSRWVLGSSTGRSVCMTGFPPFCISVGSGAVITKIGTSP